MQVVSAIADSPVSFQTEGLKPRLSRQKKKLLFQPLLNFLWSTLNNHVALVPVVNCEEVLSAEVAGLGGNSCIDL